MKLEKYINIKNVKKIIDILICIAIVILSVQKGGFYTTDAIAFNIFTSFLGLIYIFLNLKNNNHSNTKHEKILDYAIILIPLAYILPIVFKKTTNIEDSFFEMIRYLNIAILYFAIKKSENIKMYTDTIVIIAIVQSIFGIDGLGIRYFEKYLQYLNSGYLNIDIDRLSGTIQYANTVAIIEAISFFIVFDKILKLLNVDKNILDNKKTEIKMSIYFAILFINIYTIILTGSRFTLIFLAIFTIIYMCINKKYKNYIFFLSLSIFAISLIFSNISENAIGKKTIYLCYFMFILVALIFKIIFNSLYKILINKYSNSKKSILITISILLIIYLILAFNITSPLIISSNDKIGGIDRVIYDIKQNEVNSFQISVDGLEEDSRYTIYLFEEGKDYQYKFLKRFDYFSNSSGNFDYSFTPKNDTIKLKMYIQCDKGKVEVSNLKINGKAKILNYLLLPNRFMYRLEDMFGGNSSIYARYLYIKDAFKLICKSPLVGLGGEGFKNNYKQVQSVSYISSEVHNSFLQMGVESGIIGIIIIIIILYSSLKTKYSNTKFIYILLILHSFVDLDFSYMIMLVIFCILLCNNCFKNNNIEG